MKCIKCGAEIPDDSRFCEQCGTQQPRGSVAKTNAEPQAIQQRHGFVTFWLWLMVVVNTIIFFVYFYRLLSILGIVNGGTAIVLFAVGIIGALLNVVSAILLLLWKKVGFWIFVGAGIGVLLTYITTGMLSIMPVMDQIKTMAPSILAPVILYAILCIRKNGKSCWSQLN